MWVLDVLDVGLDWPKQRANFWTVQNGWTDRDAIWSVDWDRPKEACIRLGAHWHNLTNTIEPSMCGGDATFLSITFDLLLFLVTSF